MSTLSAVRRDAINAQGHAPANPSENGKMKMIERRLKQCVSVGATTQGEALEAHLARYCDAPRSLVSKTFRKGLKEINLLSLDNFHH